VTPMFPRALVEASVARGVKERPPVPGWRYVAFAVHTPTEVSAHAEGKLLMQDVIREQIGVDDCATLLRRYGIKELVGAPDEGQGDSLAHATCGALLLGEGTAR